jgi:hypothetical protein
MTTNIKSSSMARHAAEQDLSDGLKANQQTLTSFTFAGASHSTADIIAAVQSRLAADDTADTARTTWQAKLQAARDTRAATQPLVTGVRQALLVMFAGDAQKLGEFGLKPRKPRTPPTTEQRAVTAARAKATRAARHTMGSKQKKDVKGTITTIVSPTAPTAAAAPVAQSSAVSAAATGTVGAAAPRAQ